LNTTLKPATNLILCAVWIVLIVLSLTVFSFVRLAVGIGGGALGLIAGFLQARALRRILINLAKQVPCWMFERS
jgi:uncharacterized membrane protein